jgi:acetone carboxylase gamma subunit
MIESVKPDDWELTGIIEWTCPECGKKHKTEISIDPYRSLADSPPDEYCDGCENFFTIDFYS